MAAGKGEVAKVAGETVSVARRGFHKKNTLCILSGTSPTSPPSRSSTPIHKTSMAVETPRTRTEKRARGISPFLVNFRESRNGVEERVRERKTRGSDSDKMGSAPVTCIL